MNVMINNRSLVTEQQGDSDGFYSPRMLTEYWFLIQFPECEVIENRSRTNDGKD